MYAEVESLVWLTGGVIAASTLYAYLRTRDPLHPLIYLGPMMGYVYFATPLVILRQDLLQKCFPQKVDMFYAEAMFLLGTAAFCLGTLHFGVTRRALVTARRTQVSPVMRQWAKYTGFLLGGFGLGVYLWLIYARGGLAQVYGRPKGGLFGVSGYVASAPLLTIPATLLYLIASFGQRRSWRHVVVCMILMSPHLIHAFLGARRGTAFFAVGALFFGWFTTGTRRPSLGLSVATLVCVGLLMFFLGSQRERLYLGSEFYFDREALWEAVSPKDVDVGNTTVYSWGLILTSHQTQHHFWGRRYLAQILIRPIPRQLWPGKYAALGLEWMDTAPGSGGMSEFDWLNAVGWVPQAGSAAGVVADAYLEFGVWGLFVCYLVGRIYSELWKRAVVIRGVWMLLYAEAAAISVFVPTQGVTTAWFYRLLFLGIPTYVLWRWIETRHFVLLRRLAAER